MWLSLTSERKERLRDGIYSALHAVDLPRLLRAVVGKNSISIVTYHNPSKKIFRSHLSYIKVRYPVIKMDELALGLRDKKKADQLPRRAVVITLDDGHSGNYALLPIIREFRIPVLIYLVAGLVGTRRKMWTTEIDNAGGDKAEYKKMPDAERRVLLKQRFQWDPEREYPTTSYLSWREVEEMRSSGLVDFGSHSLSHPILPRCDDETAWREIAESKAMLEERLGYPIRHFSYPNGNYSPRDMSFCKDAGYFTARTTLKGWNAAAPSTNPFALKYFGLDNDGSVAQLAGSLSGLHVFQHMFLRKRG